MIPRRNLFTAIRSSLLVSGTMIGAGMLGIPLVTAEAGFIQDKRCNAALDLLESKQLPDGGWPAERKYYKFDSEIRLGNEHVDWGGTSKKAMNPWVTVDALYVLKEAGRLRIH